jgi:hypothetical protein
MDVTYVPSIIDGEAQLALYCIGRVDIETRAKLLRLLAGGEEM